MRILYFLFLITILCTLPAEAARPNILFLLSDDQRPDTIAALGNEIIQTPHIDSLVKSE